VCLEAGEPLAIELACVAPHEVADHVIDALGPQAEAAQIDLALEASAGLPPIQADHDRLVQVLDNLVGNALKFSSKGARVVVGLGQQGSDVVFSVADSGPGLSPDQIEHLFERFWQAERCDRRGCGLGLTLVKAIVDAHHGTIWVESRLGIGTTFYFTVPTR